MIYTEIIFCRDFAPGPRVELQMLPRNLTGWEHGVPYPAPRCLPHLFLGTFDIPPHYVTVCFQLSPLTSDFLNKILSLGNGIW